MKKNIIIFALIGMFLLNFVNPQPPLQTSENGLEIQTSYAEKYPLGKDMNIYAHVRDRETGNLIETDELNCSFHVYSHLKGGEPILIIEEMTPYGVGFEYNINGSYFNEKGEYSILIFCNSVTKGGFFQYTFNIEHFPEGILSLNLNETSHLVGLIIIFFFIIASFYYNNFLLSSFLTIITGFTFLLSKSNLLFSSIIILIGIIIAFMEDKT